MYYGFKDRTTYANHTCAALLTDCSAYVTREPCCGYDVSRDCLTSFSAEHGDRVKIDCDGEAKCRVRATYVSGSCWKPPRVYGDVSSYSVISYVCVNFTSIVRTSTSRPVTCGPECKSVPTTNDVKGDRNGQDDDKQNENDERMLQLIIGVSVGVGAGFIFLSAVLIVCWIRIRRKPPDSLSIRSGPSMAPVGSLPRRPSKALTLTSTMPSSHYSSFFYSDTLPSSHPNSIYPESVYSLPVDGSTAGSIGPASVLRAHVYSNDEVVVPDANSSGDLNPNLLEFVERSSSRHPPISDSEGHAAIPPQLPARPSILKPITNRESDRNRNGRCAVSTIQFSERPPDSDASSSARTTQNSGVQVTQCFESSGRNHGSSVSTDNSTNRESSSKTTRYKQSSKKFRSVSVSTEDSSSKENGAPVHSAHQAVSGYPSDPETSHRSRGGSTSSQKEWWGPLRHARSSVKSDPVSEASSAQAVPEETFVGEIPVSQRCQDKYDAVKSWLGIVKPQVPF
ncbi:hypothetical protein ACOMHN_018103 [Nucella lapillus]